VLLRRLKEVTRKRKQERKELERLQNVLQMHEDMVFAFFANA